MDGTDSNSTAAPPAAVVPARNDYDWMDAAVSAEVLKHVQLAVAAQHGNGTALDAKLTTVLGQSVTLSIATLTAATTAFGSQPWMPPWCAAGLAAASLACAVAAVLGWWGLRTQRWAMPGLPLTRTALPSVLKAQPQTAAMLMAGAYQHAYNDNATIVNSIACALKRARACLVAAPFVGLIASALTWAALRYPA